MMRAAQQRRPDLGVFKAVTIVKPSSLGDIVHALPAVAILREAMPQPTFRWLANTEWMPLLEGSPLVDEGVDFPRKSFRGVGGFWRAACWLGKWRRAERERPELLVDFQGLLRSGISSWRRGADWVMGLSDAREGAGFFHKEVVVVDAGAHAVDRYLAVPRALGLAVPEMDEIRFPLATGQRPKGWSEGLEQAVVLHPYSRGSGKSLSSEALMAMIQGLAPLPVILVGMADEAEANRVWPGQVTNWINKTSLAELLWCLRAARWVVSVDSGPMHMAAAVNPNTLGLHTWTDPRKVGPYPMGAWVWKAGRLCHRGQLTTEECQTERAVSAVDATEVAHWVRGRYSN